MADEADIANDSAQLILDAQRTIRKHSHLLPMGGCHYCDELLPRVGQLFCNSECGEDYEFEQSQRKRLGRLEGD